MKDQRETIMRIKQVETSYTFLAAYLKVKDLQTKFYWRNNTRRISLTRKSCLNERFVAVNLRSNGHKGTVIDTYASITENSELFD